MYKRKDGLLCERVKLPNGKPKDIYAHSEKEMKQKLFDFDADIQRGRPFYKIIDEWWEFHQTEIEYNTISGYIRPIKDVKEGLGHIRIRELTSLDIKRFLTAYAHAGGAKRARQTVKLRLTVIRQALDFAILEINELSVNPALAVKIPKGLSSDTRVPPVDAEIAVIKSSVDKTFGLFPFLLAFTGMRPGEGLALKDDDFDFSEGCIKVNKSLVFVDGGKSAIKPPKTKNGKRKIALLQTLANVLPKNKKGFIFSPDPSRPILEKEYRALWAQYKEETGMNFVPSQCRHYYASLLYEAGVGVKDAQGSLGHAKATTTLNIYTHLGQNRNKGIAMLLDAHIVG